MRSVCCSCSVPPRVAAAAAAPCAARQRAAGCRAAVAARARGAGVASLVAMAAAAGGSSSSAAEPETKKLWGGRFSEKIDPLMEKFNESLSFDRRLAQEDIRGSQAYARALSNAGIITTAERDSIVSGLTQVAAEWAEARFAVKEGDEDIHTANERRLGELIGAAAGKLHTGRSRNDQVATDTRLWLHGQLLELRRYVRQLISVAVERAEREVDLVMPGFTHLQPAQTVRWSQWLLCHASAWQRDDMRLRDMLARCATLPLGSGALAGNPFGVDRRALAADLGFTGGVCPNSMDAVSDRDYVAELQFWGALHMVHLSRFAEDLIVYSAPQFGLVALSDAYSTGSSLMPQKKNPDALELLRGKSGRLIGNLTGTLAVLKGTPTTYNKDFQEVWEPMYDTVDTLADCTRIAAGCLATLRTAPARMRSQLSADMLATDLAEYLVRKARAADPPRLSGAAARFGFTGGAPAAAAAQGVPFRETHHVAGAAVRAAETRGVALDALTVAELRALHPSFDEDVAQVWSYERSADSRDTEGGTSKRSVLEQVAKMRAYLAAE